MVALTKAGQGSNPASSQAAPGERDHGREHTDRGTPSCPSYYNRTGTTISRNQGQSSQGTNARCECTASRRDPNSLQCFRCQGWGHMARECPTPAMALNQSGGNERNVAQPLLAMATTANSRPPTFPPPPQTKTDLYESCQKDGTAGNCPNPLP